jgi:hypothetical protein
MKMFVKLNSTRPATDTVFVNNDSTKIAIVKQISFSASVAKQIVISYVNGSAITTLDVPAATQLINLTSVINNSNAGKDIQISVTGGMSGAENISFFMDIVTMDVAG